MWIWPNYFRNITPGGTYVHEFAGLRSPGVDIESRTRVPFRGMNADFHNIAPPHIMVPSYGRRLPEGPSAHFLYLHDVLGEII